MIFYASGKGRICLFLLKRKDGQSRGKRFTHLISVLPEVQLILSEIRFVNTCLNSITGFPERFIVRCW